MLRGDDGKPPGLVEAKRTRKSSDVGRIQGKFYADCPEKRFAQRPIIFYSNGYEHWIWDDALYPPHPVQAVYKKYELEFLIQRRGTRKMLADAAKTARRAFTSGTILRANQLQFLDAIVNHLTEHGAMEPGRLYESPNTDFSPRSGVQTRYCMTPRSSLPSFPITRS